jgi:hypothetical protein
MRAIHTNQVGMTERTFPVGVEVTLLGSAEKQRGSAIHHVLALALYVNYGNPTLLLGTGTRNTMH